MTALNARAASIDVGSDRDIGCSFSFSEYVSKASRTRPMKLKKPPERALNVKRTARLGRFHQSWRRASQARRAGTDWRIAFLTKNQCPPSGLKPHTAFGYCAASFLRPTPTIRRSLRPGVFGAKEQVSPIRTPSGLTRLLGLPSVAF
jgi:hypothetical protein